MISHFGGKGKGLCMVSVKGDHTGRPVAQGELEGAGAALEWSNGFVRLPFRQTYKAGHPKVTGPATKKRGVKNEKCQTIMLTCPSRGSIGTLPWDGPIIPYPARAMVNKFATICKQMMNGPLRPRRNAPEIDGAFRTWSGPAGGDARRRERESGGYIPNFLQIANISGRYILFLQITDELCGE